MEKHKWLQPTRGIRTLSLEGRGERSRSLEWWVHGEMIARTGRPGRDERSPYARYLELCWRIGVRPMLMLTPAQQTGVRRLLRRLLMQIVAIVTAIAAWMV